MNKAVCGLCLFASLFVSAIRANATTIYNGGFEADDFSGWTLTVAMANDVSYPPNPPPPQIPAGAGSIVSSAPRTAIDGIYVLDLEAGGNHLPGAPYNPYPQIYDSYVSRSFALNSGDIISGWAFFSNGDMYEQDSGWVRIFDNSNVQIAQPWYEVSGSNPGAPGRINTPWTHWQWTVSSSGTYTLKLGVTTMGDGLFPSDGYFDDIEVTSVPEPQTAGILAIALGCFSLKIFCRKKTGPAAF